MLKLKNSHQQKKIKLKKIGMKVVFTEKIENFLKIRKRSQ